MTLTPVIATVPVPARPPRRTPGYELRLECGHVQRRGFQDGPLPKRVVCRECADR